MTAKKRKRVLRWTAPELWANPSFNVLVIMHRNNIGTCELLNLTGYSNLWNSWNLGHNFSEQEILNFKRDGWIRIGVLR